jgi:hypothetical protein
MQALSLTAFAICVVHAVIGNAIVGLILLRRKTPLRLMWVGTPFYLYGVCNRTVPPTGRALKALALSTNIALVLSIPSLIWFMATST